MSAPGSGALRVRIRGIGLLGPGLADWTHGAASMRSPKDWQASPTVIVPPALLPPAERRRAGTVVKVSLAVAQEACAAAGIDAAGLPTVFSSSSGDGTNCHALCEALAVAAGERSVSPTRFTNSVHNASAGYWHIATANRRSSTSLCAFDASFAAGLLEAATQCVDARQPVLLVVCDVPYPEPLHAARPISDSFGVAMVIDLPGPAGAGGTEITLAYQADAAATDTACDHAGFEALRLGIPAARSLPLLGLLARCASGALVIGAADGLGLSVQVHPQ